MIKLLVTYQDEKQFGIEVEKQEALNFLTAWLEKEDRVINVQGYGLYPFEAIKVELFDLMS